MILHGVDFTSAPSKRKGITIATGVMQNDVFVLQSLQYLHDFPSFEAWLRRPGPWLAGFDLPFSFPRELVEYLGWPVQWAELISHLREIPRPELRLIFKAFCDERPVGNKFAHRATDIPAGSSPSMKWVNPPVAYMLHAGAPRLLDAGVTIPGMLAGDDRIALEAYPGMLARSITRASYKSDDKAKHTAERVQRRLEIVAALEAGQYVLGVPLVCGSFRDLLIADGSGDLLDAVLCGLSAGWGWMRRDEGFGLPEFDSLEGWIVGA
ncbi:DUF429 domain-containing protein [Undibacterium terreum]|uniref:DUF429 domain-containing protein n=1 Tax=Undibacterium terreum TaxID=1224302 RepID=A0A916UQ71_9BURK|nr:DUF429 domain-containing protein [Undibacterium terreum]GGC81340.1 hypothetical protein GCM10011396_30700 [Undibacterium terreum]